MIGPWPEQAPPRVLRRGTEARRVGKRQCQAPGRPTPWPVVDGQPAFAPAMLGRTLCAPAKCLRPVAWQGGRPPLPGRRVAGPLFAPAGIRRSTHAAAYALVPHTFGRWQRLELAGLVLTWHFAGFRLARLTAMLRSGASAAALPGCPVPSRMPGRHLPRSGRAGTPR